MCRIFPSKYYRINIAVGMALLLLATYASESQAQLPGISLNQAEYSTTEGSNVQVCVVLSTLNEPAPLQSPLRVRISTLPGTAVGGADYLSLSSFVIVFPAGSAVGTNICVEIATINDLIVEGNETFTIRIDESTDYKRIAPFASMVTILDDEGTTALPGIALNEAVHLVTEGSSVQVCVVLATLDGAVTLPSPNAVPISTLSGTAVAGADYLSLSNFSIVFPAGSAVGDLVCVEIATINDLIVEGDETFTIMINASTDYKRLAPFTSTVTILDDEETTAFPGISLNQTVYSTTEGASVQVCVVLSTLDGPTLQAPISAIVSTLPGTATGGSRLPLVIELCYCFPDRKCCWSKQMY